MATRTLIVEDESLLVMLLEDLLPELGYRVEATADSIESALHVLDRLELDIAVLDVNLGGKASFPVADVLEARGIPYLFATSYGDSGVPERYSRTRILQKPYGKADLETALASLTASITNPVII